MTEDTCETRAQDAIARPVGQGSNFSARRLLLLIRSSDYFLAQFVRFGLTTAMSAGVTVGLPIVLHEVFGVRPQTGAAVAFVIAFLVNFLSLRLMVFRSRHGAGRDFLVFLSSSLAFRGMEYLAFLAILSAKINYIIGLVSVLTLSTLAKWFWYRRVMHKGGCRSAPSQAE